MLKLNYDTIKEKLKNVYNVELLSKTYNNANQKLIYRDKDGYLYYSSWSNISQGKMASFADRRNYFVMKNLRRYIELNHFDTELLSEKYEENLLFKCKCGLLYRRTWSNFKREGCLCKKCSLKNRGLNHRNSENVMKELFIKNGYKLNGDIHTATEKVDCYDKDGYRGLLSYHSLQSGNSFDKFSFKNPYYEYNVRHYMKLSGCTSTLMYIEKKNKFCKSILHLKCACGNEYQAIWSTFANSKVFRCQRCSKKQSKYAFLTEEYFKAKHIVYDKEYSFDDCKSISKLFFDFAVFIDNNLILIEVDGQYHFKDYYGDLKLQLLRDEIKNQYCESHNIPLVRIPYWEYKEENYKKILDKEIYKYIIESV